MDCNETHLEIKLPLTYELLDTMPYADWLRPYFDARTEPRPAN